MRWLRAWLLRFCGLFKTEKRERQMAAEIESHLQMHIEDNLRSGLPPEEARRQALIRLGGVETTLEQWRDRQGIPLFETLFKDVRFGLRMLVKSPAFASVAILTLALGIGANTAAFSIINAVLLRPLPLPHGERITSIQVTPTLAGDSIGPASATQFLAWRGDKAKFDLVAAVKAYRGQVSGTEAAEEIRILQVSAEFQELLGIRPHLGRTFQEADFRSGGERVCLISHRLWQRRFGKDRSVVGRTCYLDSAATVIIGVLPHDLAFPDFESDVWTALFLEPHRLAQRVLDVYGRLAPGISARQAQVWLTEVTARSEIESPDWLRTRQITVVPIREQLISDQRTLLSILSAIAIGILLVCCANLSNLVLARHLNREREIALRASLGATRGRLVRQLLTEAMVLGLAGTVGGFVAGRWLLSINRGLLNDSRFRDLVATGGQQLDIRIVVFTLLLSLGTTMLFALIPTLHITRKDLNESLKSSPRSKVLGGGVFRISRYLIAVELAVAFILLTGTGLLVRSFVRLLSTDRGYTIDHLLTARLPTPGGISVTLGKRKWLFRELIRALEGSPDVEAVGVVTGLPLGGLNASVTLKRPGQPLDPENLPWVGINSVNADYFKAMGIRLVRGRAFDSSDTENTLRVAVINETLERQFWPYQDAIGREVMPGIQVVGIVADIRQEALESRQGPALYLPFEQRDGLAAAPNFVVVRCKGDPKGFVPTLRDLVRSVDRLQPVVDIRTMEEVLSRSVTQRRLLTSLIAAFAALAVLVSIAGIYGVLSYQVRERTREIGIRVCLGAQRSEILILLAKQLLGSVISGLLGGFLISLLVTHALSRWLYGIGPNDVVTLVSAAVAALAAALLGGVAPAFKALRVDPLAAVRME